ncbi:CTLH/CRA C-terminal to lish motif domain-domain-containing protein [Catenaria anguillulae PL171]|uniref:CTLH/CRA C-terminal to lish motif domain-domain-containing protein n=1 Tax=Catenaria anguillulae PL171 TaxID=765915 RepID=A0A1Y2H7P5_9FUNG|nr:CTLH/CRA C-terminal to lish motif domain-domain-containing protein [Catenaria anguillulae PL171]
MASEKNKLAVDGILGLETSFVKVPFEQFKRANKKAQKHIEKELGNLASAISDLAKGKGSAAKDPLKAIDSLTDKLKKLKRKLKELREEEALYTDKTQARLRHLQTLSHIKALDSPAYASWSHTRLNRLLLDYLLRQGFLESATMLAKGSVGEHESNGALLPSSSSSDAVDSYAIGGLVGSTLAGQKAEAATAVADEPQQLEKYADLEFFTQARKIEQALQARRCTRRWLGSTLEFNLRLQEFIDLVTKRDLTAAVTYAKQHLTGFSDTNLPQIQQAVTLLAFPPTTTCEPYRTLYDAPARWSALLTQFRLSGLKTAQCAHASDRNPNCPVCVPGTYGELAKGLPMGHHANSSYVCRITGALMNEDNPPMATPDGYVYSHKAVQDMAVKNHGQFRCPRTGSVYSVGALKKLYLT